MAINNEENISPALNLKPTRANSYRLGHSYKDTGSNKKPGDQFLAWINLPGSGMLNSPGIRPLKYVNRLNDLPACLVLVTHEQSKGVLNPWEDVVDYDSGQILYWGDAKQHPTKRSNEFLGNRCLELIHNYILEGGREFIPPVIHFTKPRAGEVVFSGLCVMDKLEPSWFDDHGKPVRNYRAHLTILDADEISVTWLHNRMTALNTVDLERAAPSVWRQYILGNTRKLDIWRSKVRSQADQLPPIDSNEAQILHQLHSLTPTQFEAVVVAVFRQETSVCHTITRTRPTADGGFDFFGSFVLPRPFSYHIEFLGEAKKYSRSTAVQPKDISRLVARLGRGQFGVFVTTSYYTKQAQQEVYHDRYPARLVSGFDLVNMMKELRIVSNGVLNSVWLQSVISCV